jgi:uncharacterized membrane protein
MKKQPPNTAFDEQLATGWARIELYGDRDKAGGLIHQARTQLGGMRVMYGVNQRIAEGESGGFYHATNTLDDGSVIQTMTNDGQDIIRIHAASGEDEELVDEPRREDRIAVAGHYVYNTANYYYAPYRWISGLGFDYPDFIGGYYYGVAEGLSEDGETLCGYMGGDDYEEAFLWTPPSIDPNTGVQTGGTVGLGRLGIDEHSHAAAISADGATVVGYSGSKAFVWTDLDGMRPLTDLPCEIGTSSVAAAVSGDGGRIAGYSNLGNGHGSGTNYGVIWDASGQILTQLPLDASFEEYEGAYIARVYQEFSGSGASTAAESIYVPSTWNTQGTITTTDASGTTVGPNSEFVPPYPYEVTGSFSETITGVEAGGNVSRTFTSNKIKWQVPYGMTVYGMSGDGSTVCGACGKGPQAFVWSEEFGLEMLGFLGEDTISVALAVSADGSTVTGYSAGEENTWFTWSRPVTDALTGVTTGGLINMTQGSGNAVTQAGMFTAGRSGNYADDNDSLSVARAEPDANGLITQHDIGLALNIDKDLGASTPNEIHAITSISYVTYPDDSVDQFEDLPDAQFD